MASNSPSCQSCGQPTNSGFVCTACHPAPRRTTTVQQQDQQARQIQDMATIIKRLCRQLRKAEPAGDYKRLSDDALSYLRRHDLLGSPMQDGEP